MSAQTTRLLVLGVVQIFGPANGYQLRRELLSWEVERWAHLNPGSIYSMLTTLEKQGAIERHDLTLDEGGREVAVYTMTDAGAVEFERLVFDAIADVPDSGDALPLRVAMSFGPGLTRARFLDALGARIIALRVGMTEFGTKVAGMRDPLIVPPHVLKELEFELALIRTQLEWLLGFEAEVQAGELEFRGEEGHAGSWTPPADDPGWKMAHERERYLAKIASNSTKRA
ncbi:PadR family transcriptional regulator [soil metagenome]